MKNGGFDIIIGNPLYVRIQDLGITQSKFFNSKFESATKNYDIYVLFIERSMKLPARNGILGFILASKFINADSGTRIKNVISKSKTLYKIVDFKDF
ncbi:MAG: Eco57I restriction-modification methylase domain-containing protein [Thermoplasmatales archaeon]